MHLPLLLPLLALLGLTEEQQKEYAGVRDQAQKHFENGKLYLARVGLKKILDRLREDGGEPTQFHADVLTDLGKVYRHENKQIESIGAFDDAVDIQMILHGPGDPRVAMAVDKVADGYMQAQNYEEAHKIYNKLILAMRKSYGGSHPGYELTLSKYANAALSAGKPKAAIKSYEELIGLRVKSAQIPAPDTVKNQDERTAGSIAQIRVQYARALAQIGKFEDALVQANKAQEGFAGTKLFRGSMEHAASFNGVAGVLEKLNRDDEAVAEMQKAYDIAAELNEPGIGESAKGNLEGLKAHVARKRRAREAKGAATSAATAASGKADAAVQTAPKAEL
mmetsp:Transcript_46674/g.122577  ORF Transcript_46674/g.122577 Transcript_46674/m.122577 type:complete len:336 (+) Transcript_46674:48-1055(+)